MHIRGGPDRFGNGTQYEYLWADGVKVRKPIKCSAPVYVNSLFDWIENQVGLLSSQSCDPTWVRQSSSRYVSAPRLAPRRRPDLLVL